MLLHRPGLQTPAITANRKIQHLFARTGDDPWRPELSAARGETVISRTKSARLREGHRRTMVAPAPDRLEISVLHHRYPDANAFNHPGGYVSSPANLSRYEDEDELRADGPRAGPRCRSPRRQRQSELFKKILNVTQLGDRKDITDKFNC